MRRELKCECGRIITIEIQETRTKEESCCDMTETQKNSKAK